MAKAPHSLPHSIPARLTLVGRLLYGKTFKAKLADGLGISRNTLWEWMNGGGKLARRNINADLIELLDSERDGAAERSIQIAALTKQLREAA